MTRFNVVVKKIREGHRELFESVKEAVMSDKEQCYVSAYNDEEQEAMFAVLHAWDIVPTDVRHTQIRFKITEDLKKTTLGLMKAESLIQHAIASNTLNAYDSVDLFKPDLSYVPWYLTIYGIKFEIKDEWLTFNIPTV